MFGFQQFNQDRASTNSRVSRVYSPNVIRPRTQVLQKAYSPQPLEKFDSFQYTLTDFINNLQDQVQRLSPNFAFKYSAEPPLIQALNFISQSIDSILGSKKDLKKTPSSPSITLQTDLEKAKETNKNLQKYEKILKKKQEKFENEKSEVKNLKKKLQDWEIQLGKQQAKIQEHEKNFLELQKQEKLKFQARTEDLEKKILEFADYQERTQKKFDELGTQVMFEKQANGQLERCLSESKAKLLEDQKVLSGERISLEQEKWRISQAQRKADEESLSSKLAQEKVAAELGLLNQAKQDFLKEKNEFYQQRNLLKPEPVRRTEDRTFEFSGDLESEIRMNDVTEKDLEQKYQKIQYELENTSRELEERQFSLDEQEESLHKAEKDLKYKFDNIKKIESSLTETQIQVEELKTNTLPDLENQSNLLGNLVREIQLKKNELEVSIFKLTKEIEFVQKYKKKLDAETEARDRYLAGVPEGQYEEVKELVEELEGKLRKILKREEELQEEGELIEEERRKMVENAEFLKQAHLDLNRGWKEIEEEKGRIRRMETELEKRRIDEVDRKVKLK